MTLKQEDQIKQQLRTLGIYQPAFDGMIGDLATLRRERHRARAAWKKTVPDGAAPSMLHPLYALIRQQSRDIAAMEDALGLTPKALRRLKAASIVPEASAPVDAQGGSPAVSALLATLRDHAAANANVSDLDHGHD